MAGRTVKQPVKPGPVSKAKIKATVAAIKPQSAPKAPKEKGLERKTSWIELTYEDKELLKETGKLDKLYPNEDRN